jgi:hypothetical protein
MTLFLSEEIAMTRTKWTNEMVADRIKAISAETGVFPSVSFLKETGQNDLACQIARRGGSLAWAERLGLKREHSDSDTGWEGERAVMEVIAMHGLAVTRSAAVRWPFDLLVGDLLRVDVKSARFAQYGSVAGWFYRIGKAPQADLIALHQLDTGETYWIPWTRIPRSNVTISRSGGIYAPYREEFEVVHLLLQSRRETEARLDALLLPKAA